MKKILTLLTLLFAVTFLYAQSHARLSYQSVVRNMENQLVVQEEITVQFQLHNHSPLAAAVYAEQHTVTSNQNGLISLIIGEGTGQTGDLDAVTWNDAYICTQYALAGEVVLTDTQKITAVPYACYADKVPLSAIEEHLGSTQLVTINMLQDSLSQYTTHQELQNNISLLVTRQELADSMAHTVSPEELADSLSHYIQQGDFNEAVGLLVTRQELADSMVHTVSPEDLAAATDTLVGRQELADSLSHYIQQGELDNAVGLLVTRQELADSMAHTVSPEELAAATDTLVGRQEFADSLSHYIQQGEFDNAVGLLVTRQELADSLQQIANNGNLIALVQNLQNQINELQALQETVDMFTVPSSPSNTFTLSFTPLPNHPVLMFINGVFISTQAFSLSGNTLTYRYNYNGNKALTEGDRIQIYYSHN